MWYGSFGENWIEKGKMMTSTDILRMAENSSAKL